MKKLPKNLQDFKNAYATILNNICCKWIRDEDSSNDYDNVSVKQCFTFGNIKIIYQPSQDGDDVIGHVLMIFSKSIPKKEMNKIVGEVNKMLMDDYYELKEKCGGKWYTDYKKEDVFNILGLKKDFAEYKTSTWKLSFLTSDYTHSNGRLGWVPKRIQEYLGIFDEEYYNEVAEIITNYKL